MAAPDLIELFVVPLNRIGLTYMVTGSVASSIYGQARFTEDIDLVITCTAADVAALRSAFDPAAFYVPPAEVIENERRRASYGHFNIIHADSGFKADLFVVGDDVWARDALARRRQELSPSGETIWLAPPEYVILSKLRYLRDGGSLKHVTDIRSILRVSSSTIDTTWIHTAVQQLGLRPEWARVEAAE